MKQVAILIICSLGLVHFSASHVELDSCNVNDGANIASLEEISSQLTGLITTLKEDLSCRKPGGKLNPVRSCKDLPPNSESGEYWVLPNCSSDPFKAHCDMSNRCNSSTGGWMRVANLDMTNSSQQCPSGFRLVSRSTAPRRTCGRSVYRGCQSVVYPANGVEYSRVCGRVKAYQFGSPDAFFRYDNSHFIDSHYVDGVSITHGRSPRNHIWTFAATWTLSGFHNDPTQCPCGVPNYRGYIPSFIGNDYFCESGHHGTLNFPSNIFWDGVGCDSTSTCCTFNNPPWFCKNLPQPTTDDIELRLCGDQSTGDEDTPIEEVEIYVY